MSGTASLFDGEMIEPLSAAAKALKESEVIAATENVPGEGGLPEGWTMTTLGTVTSPSKDKVEPQNHADSPYLSLEHIEAHTTRIIGHGYGRDVSSTKAAFKAGDVLYGKLRPYLNKVVIPDFDGIASTDILVFPQSPCIDSRFLLRFLSLNKIVDFAHQHSAGVQMPRIGFDKLSEIELPLPPLTEQQRIVDQVEALLASVNEARARLDRVPALLKRFRQSVLASACSGRLTADWREEQADVEPAARLLERIQAERRAKDGSKYRESVALNTSELPELPEGWEWTQVDQIALVGTGATPLRKRFDYYAEGTIPWVTSSAVNQPLIDCAEEFITEVALKETNAKVFPAGTLVVAMYGEGQTRGGVSELGIEAATNQALAALQFIGEAIHCKTYVKQFFLKNYEDLRQLSAGGVQPNLNLSIIRETVLPLPPREEQAEIRRRIVRLFALADAVEKRIEAAKRRTEKVAQSVLAKAFRGALVTTEAELARQQGREYEPASALLQRIPVQSAGQKRSGGGLRTRSASKT